MFASKVGFTRAIILVSALLGGLLCYIAGYRAGVSAGAKTIAEVAIDENLTAASNPPEESTPLRSQVVLKKDDHSVAKPSLAGLTKFVRFKSSGARVYSTTSESADWKEDLALGYPDGKKGDSTLYRCAGETTKHVKYSFLAAVPDCYGVSKSAQETGSFVTRRLQDRLHLPVYLCMTPEKAFYPSLNYRCEDPSDTLRDLVGYFLTAEVVRQ